MKDTRILVIDDDESITTTVSKYLAAAGYRVAVINDGEGALAEVRKGEYPVIISDLYIDRVTGLDVLRAATAGNPNAAVIIMTARGSVRTTVEAELGGAFEYIAKPFEMRDLLKVVKRAETSAGEAPAEGASEDLEQFGNMIGFSPAMVGVYRLVARSAKSDDTVLIIGETGVGKELVARAIHDHSGRAERAFVAVDSGAIPGTLWESEIFGSVRGAFTGADRDRPGVADSARGGTIFFDEIGEIPLDFQAKLLRFLQEKEYRPVGSGAPRKADVRVIAATNRRLEQMVRDGKFREDLFYRLNVLRIEVPPLRERRQDIPFLVRRFLEQATEAARKRVTLAPDALDFLERQPWPGNVRQLQNTIQRVVALGLPGTVSAEDLHPLLETPEAGDEEEASDLSEVERRLILRVLEQAGGNKTRAAEVLGIQRRTLYKKLARIERERSGHIDVPDLSD
ncbi:MAG: sigma-54-dependent Fis family transcriptional regulator [Bryobacteraceae bacterium]|nr:sigma-54-dependent Fis family transcriptional regulator [Bryobacteraceae bacterium]